MTVQQWEPGPAAAYQEPTQVTDYQTRAVSRLAEWATAADAAYTVAVRLVQSSFVPASFRGKPVEATGAILAGSELGLSPMAALRSFDVIQGQAAPRAVTLRAVAQSYGHDIEVVESTATRCKVRARRRGGGWQTVTWTIDRAKELGLTSKENWRKQPIAMLIARATSEAARLVAADAILGIAYSAEELADGAVATDAPSVADAPSTAPSGTRRMSRRQQPPSEPEETIEPATEAVPAEDQGEPPGVTRLITQPQSRKLHAILREQGIDRDAALGLFSDITGRIVESSKDLTQGEASIIIDTLSTEDADAGDVLPGVD